ncbi:MAG: DUF3761 domain-containing protein [Patescibacteria group bacterium]|mgnify:CR=1 FL=1
MGNFIKNHKWLVAIGGVILLGTVASAVSEPAPSATSQTSTYQTPTYQVQPTKAPVYQAQPVQSTQLSNDNYYTNVDGNQVHSPAYSNTAPAGASAQCRDGTYSFSQHRSGTCSHHGGVSSWL